MVGSYTTPPETFPPSLCDCVCGSVRQPAFSFPPPGFSLLLVWLEIPVPSPSRVTVGFLFAPEQSQVGTARKKDGEWQGGERGGERGGGVCAGGSARRQEECFLVPLPGEIASRRLK